MHHPRKLNVIKPREARSRQYLVAIGIRTLTSVLAVLAVAPLAGCGSRLSDQDARTLCTWVSMGGISVAEKRAQEELGMSGSGAADAVREAIENHCRQYSGATG